MELTAKEMEQILDWNLDLITDDEDAVSLEFEIDDSGDVRALVLFHRHPDQAKQVPAQRTTPVAGRDIVLPLKVVQGPEAREDIGGPEDGPPFDADLPLAGTIGMSGTTVRQGNFWGTLCLSGSRISIVFEGTRKCSLDHPFLLSNSHVFHGAGLEVKSYAHQDLGTVTCLYNLEAPTTFDTGIARGTGILDPAHAFLVFNPGGQPRRIEGLKTPFRGMQIGKQGARSGWSSGQVSSPMRTRVAGHRAVYPGWRATYSSLPGDSGSPILHEDAGKLYLVGIHFASGGSFQSWNNASVSASP